MQQQPFTSRLGSPFIELSSIDSTNNYALERIREGKATHGAAFFAHEQTAGKGRMGRKWISEKGANIALSVVIKPDPLLISMQFKLSAYIAIAVQKLLIMYAGNEVKIKWPNDLYWQDRKIGGILIENIIGGTQPGWQWAIAGIGLNINQTLFDPGLINPVSLKQVTGKNYDTIQLAKELCDLLDKEYIKLQSGNDEILEEYNQRLYKLNTIVKLKKNNSVFQTSVKGVSKTGELITHNTVMEERFSFGEVSWVM